MTDLCDWCRNFEVVGVAARFGKLLALCGRCRSRDQRCYICREFGHEVVDGEIMCLTCSVNYKEKRAHAIKAEFLQLVGVEA